ncbi:MAG: Fe2+-dependent dioxygenase [Chromatiales bacterium]|jgi:PKHD-type hydroxylase|nr:Fe2+-dependent dioxygenase [Chromatiales bacterium]
MMHIIPALLSPAQVRQCREALESAPWVDGRLTAGHIAVKAKSNLQLAEDDPVAVRLGEFILSVLAKSPYFIAATLPLRVLSPRFNRYEGGGAYGNHIDNAIFSVPGSPDRVRSDISATLFFSDPDEYEGGELVIEDTYGTHQVKLPAGHMVIYPGTSLHRVTPVTRGTRYAAFFWTQSLVRDDGDRALLLSLDRAIQDLGVAAPDHPALSQLAGVYHNLLRKWSDT